MQIFGFIFIALEFLPSFSSNENWLKSFQSQHLVAKSNKRYTEGLVVLAKPNTLQLLTAEDTALLRHFDPDANSASESDENAFLARHLAGLTAQQADCSGLKGTQKKDCKTQQAHIQEQLMRSFGNWPKPCAIFVYGTSMGADLLRNGVSVNLSTSGNLYALPLPSSLPSSLAKFVPAKPAKILAKSYVEEMSFARNKSDQFSRLLLGLRALECDLRFHGAFANFDFNGNAWGIIFAHSFINDLMLGEALLPWTEKLVTRDTPSEMIFLGANSGSEAFFVAVGLGIRVVGIELRCDLVRLSQLIAQQYLPGTDIDFRCMDATKADLSKAWIVHLDCEAWPYQVILETFAHMAASALPVGAAVAAWRSSAVEMGDCRMTEFLQKSGWELRGDVRVKTSWDLKLDKPSVAVWVKTSKVNRNAASYGKFRCEVLELSELEAIDASIESIKPLAIGSEL